MANEMKIRDVMTKNPITMSNDDTVLDAAMAMRDADIGDVLVLEEGGKLAGIVTDRDIVVRAVATGKDARSVKLGAIASRSPITVSVDASVEEAIRLMRQKAIRRLPVTENGRAIGVVSLGDLAVHRDRESALGQISAAAPNN